MSRYELSLCADYVNDWGVTEAVRELFQNSLDQQTIKPGNEMLFNYYDGILTVANKESILDSATLLLGYSTKREETKLIGKFGEGYKLALLVLLRMGKEVKIYNYGNREVWYPRLVKSKKYNGQKILVIETDKKHIWECIPDNNLTFKIEGITEEEYSVIVENILHCQSDLGEILETPKGRILLDPKYKGKIFVNGLYVCKFDSYKYGYDILPEFIKIDRDRKLVSDFDLRWLASTMWISSGSYRMVELAKEGAADVYYIRENWKMNVNICEDAFNSFTKQYGPNAMPVVNQPEMENMKKLYPLAKPVIVSSSYYHIVTSSASYEERLKSEDVEILTSLEKLWNWFTKVRQRLYYEDEKEFEIIYKELENGGGE